MRALLLRHGATAGNEARRYVGRRTDEPLSEWGRAQCLRAGRWDLAGRVYTSPLLRARQTAAICFPHAVQVPLEGLAEFDFGDFEGRTADEMEHDAAYRRWVESNCEGTCPGGESLADFVARTWEALDFALRDAEGHRDERVVVVAHGGTVMAALDGFYDKSVGNCEGYLAEVVREGDSYAFVNPVHVAGLVMDASWSTSQA